MNAECRLVQATGSGWLYPPSRRRRREGQGVVHCSQGVESNDERRFYKIWKPAVGDRETDKCERDSAEETEILGRTAQAALYPEAIKTSAKNAARILCGRIMTMGMINSSAYRPIHRRQIWSEVRKLTRVGRQLHVE